MGGDRRIENSLPVLLEGRQGARFVGPHQPRITDHVGRKDSHELTVDTFFGHGCARSQPDELNVRGHFEKSTGARPIADRGLWCCGEAFDCERRNRSIIVSDAAKGKPSRARSSPLGPGGRDEAPRIVVNVANRSCHSGNTIGHGLKQKAAHWFAKRVREPPAAATTAAWSPADRSRQNASSVAQHDSRPGYWDTRPR